MGTQGVKKASRTESRQKMWMRSTGLQGLSILVFVLRSRLLKGH